MNNVPARFRQGHRARESELDKAPAVFFHDRQTKVRVRYRIVQPEHRRFHEESPAIVEGDFVKSAERKSRGVLETVDGADRVRRSVVEEMLIAAGKMKRVFAAE